MSAAPSAKLELKLTFDEGKLRSELSSLSKVPEGERKALRRAINRALLGTRTDIVADMRRRVALKAGDIRKGIFVQTPWWKSHSHCDGYVRLASGPLALAKYDVRPLRQTAQKGKLPSQYRALSYRLTRGGKLYDNTAVTDIPLVSKLFMIKGQKSGKFGVYFRLQGTKYVFPMQQSGPSLQFWFSRAADQNRILAGAEVRFRKELSHQVAHLGGGGR